eukprot:g30109.t1
MCMGQELMNKMGGEFMSLGFIAFMIFCSNQLGFFDFIAERLPACGKSATPDCVMLPYTGIDWLHLIELVHVQLFVGGLLAKRERERERRIVLALVTCHFASFPVLAVWPFARL